MSDEAEVLAHVTTADELEDIVDEFADGVGVQQTMIEHHGVSHRILLK